MTYIDWMPEYSVHVKILDDQHKKMIEFMNRMYDIAGESIPSAEAVNTFFSEIDTHLKEHFATEEKYFDLYQYENTEVHKLAHAQFLSDFEALKARYYANEADSLYLLIQLLEDHIYEHIMKYDKKYVKCFAEHGLR